ncbi:hypothetical protein [Nonomuraea turkmeniaca]|uniref:hypothetical protein n=1 Tax=Nonomuraea turkmeniaca TaxID=103838 RepID=UPI001B877C66|nr:hypothetical protein [Nonomuraea turkmeniaca]
MEHRLGGAVGIVSGERTLDLTWIEEPVRRWDAEGLGVSRFLRVFVLAHAHDLPVSPIGATPVALLHAAT